MNGGFPHDSLSLVYGEASTGKTTLLMHCLVQNLDSGKALFIDSDQSFSITRLFQIAQGLAEDIAEKILLFSPNSFLEQTSLIENLENYLTSHMQLLVIDSITSLYSASLRSSGNVFTQNRQLGRQLAYLAELASRKSLCIIVTGHVHARPLSNNRAELVANRLLEYWPSTILRLSSLNGDGLKVATLEKHFNAQHIYQKCSYKIVSEGLVEITSGQSVDGGPFTSKWN